MRTKHAILATAAIMMVACSNDEKLGINTQPQEITIDALVKPSTKAILDNGVAFPTTYDMKVSAQWHSTTGDKAWHADGYQTWIDNNVYTYDAGITTNGSWKPATPVYWPKGTGALTFMAYAPNITVNASATSGQATAATINEETGIDINGFNSAQIENPLDLLYATKATAAKSADKDNTDTYHGVPLTFNHALTQLAFTAKTQEAYRSLNASNEAQVGDVEIKLIKVELTGLNSVGSFDYDGTTAAWKDQVAPANYTAFEVVAGTVIGQTNANNTENDVIDAADELFKPILIIPQSVSETPAIEITYQVNTTVKLGTPNTVSQLTEKATIKLEDLFTSSTKQFEIGKKYTFNILIGLDQIHISPSITNWTDGSFDGTNTDGVDVVNTNPESTITSVSEP